MSSIVNGRELAQEIKAQLKIQVGSLQAVKLAVVCVGGNEVTMKYIERKIAFGKDIGVEVVCFDLLPDTPEEEVIDLIERLNNDESVSAIVVQLPLPANINSDNVLAAIGSEKDVDALGKEPVVDSPVVLAVKTIFSAYDVEPSNKIAVVIGKGRLVGKPVAVFLAQAGAEVTQFDLDNKVGLPEALGKADIVVLGAGVAGLIKPEMLKQGVVLIDAATSELGGKIVGDADPACVDICSVFTPVPGGVGPLTVACLFKNLISLATK
ncbi:MAG: methylenetetrahydrofolate dehydrogenase / methenyltetrahydrofolate cyclohydrolase [Patescibacteria group bacterium]|nr:methylenetetrahydrofolate dehydrogenase / methenyltetrahydrofolate cyclohydrolase [Patescibacteria group bacterium]